MKVVIKIVVDLPRLTAEQRLAFIEGVMAVFRGTFPEAEPLTGPDAPSPVTVTISSKDDEGKENNVTD